MSAITTEDTQNTAEANVSTHISVLDPKSAQKKGNSHMRRHQAFAHNAARRYHTKRRIINSVLAAVHTTPTRQN